MEFRCRLGTTSGEIIEGIYVAQSEAALRRELEDKGLHVLSLKPRLGLGSFSFGQGRKITRHEFLVFNQELATLLKAGMPLVQSLDILRTRLTNPVFKSVLDDVHEKVRGGTALSDAFAAHGELFPSVYTASLMAGERSGNLDAVLRRFVAYSKTVDAVRTKTISAMMYPVILIALAIVLVGIIVVKVVPTFAEFYSSFDADLPLSTRVIVGISDFVRAQFWLIVIARGRRRRRVHDLDAAAGTRHGVRSLPAEAAVHRRQLPQVFDLAAGAHAGDAARRRHPARQFARDRGALDRQSPHGPRSSRSWRSACARARALPATLLERQTVPDVAIKMIEVGESTGALHGNAEQPGRFLRRGN